MSRRRVALVLIGLVCILGVRATPAAAFNPLGAMCSVVSLGSSVLGKACGVLQNGGRFVTAAKRLLTGHVGSALKTALGGAGRAVASHGAVALSLAAIGAWVLGGAKFALRETAKVISETTTPQLGSSWFSATYWRVAGIAALLTLPFLFAAAIQALVRSDLALLLRTVLGYLPLALLTVSVAAPVTTLLLSASDELSRLVGSAAGQPGAGALGLGGALAGISALAGSPFLLFFLGLLTVAGAITLWLELLIREAAVYVVVLMLPLAFAALVWPARRAWAVRAVEVLVALILSKFAIVAVLSLGGAAMDQAFGHGLTAPLVGLVLVMMGAFAPWVLLRLVPLADLASAAVGSIRGEARLLAHAERPFAIAAGGEAWAARATSDMRRAADEAAPALLPGPSEPTSGSSAEPDGGPDRSPDEGPEPPGAAGQAQVPEPEPPAPGPSGGAGIAVAGGGAGRGPAAEGRAQRAPGLPEMFQADDLTWRPLVLGTEEGWPPRLWPPQADAGPSEPPGDEAAEQASLLPPSQPPPDDDSGARPPGLAPETPPPGLAAETPPPPSASVHDDPLPPPVSDDSPNDA
ncbi:MAG: hypothetical protein ACJ764_15325 [Solirubrobacteraceae bacterium]